MTTRHYTREQAAELQRESDDIAKKGFQQMRWSADPDHSIRAVLATLAGTYPDDIPEVRDSAFRREIPPLIEQWARDSGYALMPVWPADGAAWREVAPEGRWLALVLRADKMLAGVLAAGTSVWHDPSGASGSFLESSSLVFAHDRTVPAGYRLVEVAP